MWWHFGKPAVQAELSSFEPHLISHCLQHVKSINYINVTLSKPTQSLQRINMSFNSEFSSQRELPGTQFNTKPSVCRHFETCFTIDDDEFRDRTLLLLVQVSAQ